MAWIYLIVAGLLEIGWAAGLKAGAGLTRPWIMAATLAAMIASIALLGLSMRSLPLSTAYAVWTGIGSVGSVLVGLVALGENASPFRLLCVAAIAVGIVGLKLSEP